MKIWKYTCFFVLGTLPLLAASFVGKQVDQDLEVTYSYYQDNWVMGLSDGSSWQLLPLKEKRKQTWGEWWNGATPKDWELSDEFFFDRANWKGKYKISVYEASDSIATGYDFILVNSENQQKVFARFIPHGTDLIPKIEYAKTIIEQAKRSAARVLKSYGYIDNLLILDNQTSWKLNLLEEKYRSFSQWWNGEQIDQPDPEFVSKADEWKPFDQIVVYDIQFDNNLLFEKYHVSTRDQLVYLVENLSTGKLVYANSVTFNNLLHALEQHATDQYYLGYSLGYDRGYSDGNSDGYSRGYSKGRADSQF